MPCDPAVCGLRGPGAQSESHPETQAKAGGSHGLEAGPTGCASPAPRCGLGSARLQERSASRGHQGAATVKCKLESAVTSEIKSWSDAALREVSSG